MSPMPFLIALALTGVLAPLTAHLEASEVSAGESEDQCPEAAVKTYVFYGNGMFTSIDQARANQARLTAEMVASGTARALEADPKDLRTCVAYNFNESWSQELVQVLQQKIADTMFADREHALRRKRFLLRLFAAGALPADVLDSTKDHWTKHFTAAAIAADPDLAAHVHGYQSRLATGARVIVVSHSQGNFYSNAAYTALTPTEKSAFGQVMVATPTKTVASGGPYTTFDNDLAMKLVRLAYPVDTLPANFVGALVPGDALGHGFVESYLGFPPSRDKIMKDIADVGRGLKAAPALSTPLTITVTGAGSGHYSLYVYEPDGRQVYYQDRSGDLGAWTTGTGAGGAFDRYETPGPIAAGSDFQVAVYYQNAVQEPGQATITFAAGAWSQVATMPFAQPDPIATLETPRRFGDVRAPAAGSGGAPFTVTPTAP